LSNFHECKRRQRLQDAARMTVDLCYPAMSRLPNIPHAMAHVRSWTAVLVAGGPLQRGDVLRLINLADQHWWLAQLEGRDKSTGYIPGPAAQPMYV